VDTRLNQDKTELGVLVLPVDFQMLAHCDRLLDEVPKVLRDGWSKSYPQTRDMHKMRYKVTKRESKRKVERRS